VLLRAARESSGRGETDQGKGGEDDHRECAGRVSRGEVGDEAERLGQTEPRLWPRWREVIEYVETIWRKPDDGIWEALQSSLNAKKNELSICGPATMTNASGSTARMFISGPPTSAGAVSREREHGVFAQRGRNVDLTPRLKTAAAEVRERHWRNQFLTGAGPTSVRVSGLISLWF
jgi:hypothetical protein